MFLVLEKCNTKVYTGVFKELAVKKPNIICRIAKTFQGYVQMVSACFFINVLELTLLINKPL